MAHIGLLVVAGDIQDDENDEKRWELEPFKGERNEWFICTKQPIYSAQSADTFIPTLLIHGNTWFGGIRGARPRAQSKYTSTLVLGHHGT